MVKISPSDQPVRNVAVEEPIYLAEYGSDRLVISCQESDEGQSAYVYASVTLMCVDPYSGNQELALDLLEYTLENLSPLARAAL